MRRPAFCGGVAVTEDDCYCSGPLVSPDLPSPDTDEGRLAKVKRILTGTLMMGGRRGRVFGVRLEELPLGREGLPKIALRLCGFIENYGLKCAGLFRLSAGNPKLVERLRISFDRTGEADLETTADPQSVASLLKLWLRELPEPVIGGEFAEELLDIQEKFHGEVCEWRDAVCQALLSLPELNLHLLHYLLRFLHRYDQHSHPPKCHYLSNGGIATVFAPLLIAGARSQIGRSNVATQLMGKMIRDVKHIFQGRFVEHAYQAAVGGDWPSSASLGNNRNLKDQSCLQRKRKDRHGGSSQSQDRKVIRSNSEERPLENNDKDNIRRVSSHEDFSLANNNHNKNNNNSSGKGCFLSELIDSSLEHGVRYSMPLHDHNSTLLSHSHSHHTHHTHSGHHEEDLNALLDEEHERRRRSERSARSVAPRGRRNLARRRKVHKSHQHSTEDRDSGSSKENEEDGESNQKANPLTPVSSSTSDEDSGKDGSQPHSFLQLHPQERDRSPSPSPSPATPPVGLTTLHELVDRNEPLKAMGPWIFPHRQPEEELVMSHVMLSPRNSMVLTRRLNMDPNVPPSPPQEHMTRGDRVPSQDDKIKQLNKQINSVKRKLKKYEEDFDAECGYRTSQSDKMNSREVKKLGAELLRLRKEMKGLKEESSVTFLAKPVGLKVSEDPSGSTHHIKGGKVVSMEETLQEVERHLQEKRQLENRPSNLEELTKEQLLDEKVAVQKSLLYLESVFGRPVSRVERDLVRPLYDRYRALKRMVIRMGTYKLKDSISELATILEHETMDFTSTVPVTSSEEPTLVTDTVEPAPDDQLENLHALPLSQLLIQQQTVREEKKRLRRSLREFEEEFQRRTGKKLQKEDRAPMDAVYNSYKQAKAKLRLLEALVTKQTS